MPKSVVRWLFVAVSVFAILVATLRPGGATLPSGWSFAIASGEKALAEAIQNLLLFIPFGAALAAGGRRPFAATLLGAALSFAVEFLQQWIPGRDPSVGDIICNTISTAIGVGLVRFAPAWLTPPPERRPWRALGTAIAALTVWLATGALLNPIIPPPPYHEARAPSFNHWGLFRGQILSVTAGPLPLSRLQVTAIFPDRSSSRTAPLVAVLDERQTKVLVLGAHRRDLTLHHYNRATQLTLDQPDVRWRDALAQIAPGDTFTVQSWRGEHGLCLNVNSARRCGLGYTIGDGWKLLFYPEHFPAWMLGALNAIWVGAWLLGVGWWARQGRRITTAANNDGGEGRRMTTAAKGGEGRRRAANVTATAIVILGLFLVPALTGLKATPLTEWLGVIVGFATGWWLSGARPKV